MARLLRGMVIAGLVLGGLADTATANQVDEPDRLSIVSLGDSYISGNGAGDYEEGGDCWRSANAFPVRYAELLKGHGVPASVTHLACGGSQTSDIDAQLALARPVAASADLILLTIGGNDLNYAGRLGTCAVAVDVDGRCPLTGNDDQTLEDRIRAVLTKVANAFPSAQRVILVGYPDLDSPRCGPVFADLNAAFYALDAAQSEVVDDLDRQPPRPGIDFHFVSLTNLYRNRGPCRVWDSIEGPDAPRWIRSTEGHQAEKGHPTEQGHAATAALLVELDFHTHLKRSASSSLGGPRILVETSPRASAKTMRGSVMGETSRVAAVRVVAKDAGLNAIGLGERWWNGTAWSTRPSIQDASLKNGRWEFSWNPDPEGSGKYAVFVFPVDGMGFPLSGATVHRISTAAGTPETPVGTVQFAGDELRFRGSLEIGAASVVPLKSVALVIRHRDSGHYWNGVTWTANVADPAIVQSATLGRSAGRIGWSYAFEPGANGSFDANVFSQSALGENSPALNLSAIKR